MAHPEPQFSAAPNRINGLNEQKVDNDITRVQKAGASEQPFVERNASIQMVGTCMRSLIKIAALLGMTSILVSCGGGSSPSSQSSAPPCDSNTLWASHPAASGRGIPDNNVSGTSVSWDNQNCQIRSVTSAFIEVCLNHPRPSDLTWSVTPPNAGTSTSLSVSGNWITNSTTCSSVGDKFQRIDLLSSLSSTVATRGTWQLQVKDLLTGDTGTLNQWRVIIQGNS